MKLLRFYELFPLWITGINSSFSRTDHPTSNLHRSKNRVNRMLSSFHSYISGQFLLHLPHERVDEPTKIYSAVHFSHGGRRGTVLTGDLRTIDDRAMVGCGWAESRLAIRYHSHGGHYGRFLNRNWRLLSKDFDGNGQLRIERRSSKRYTVKTANQSRPSIFIRYKLYAA